MKVVIPNFSCIVDESEFQDALDQGYAFIYVVTAAGILKHVKLYGDKFARLKVDRLPVCLGAVTVGEEVNFLPAGKIPPSLLDDIVALFKAVIKEKASNVEAHAFILWDKELGYYVFVPTQEVSGARVTCSWLDIPDGATIVVDIHSHNTMGAFFSSTDNTDDAKHVMYSGVIGQLNRPAPAMVFRFNLQGSKLAAEVEDIFETKGSKGEVNPAWLSKISIFKPKSSTPLPLPTFVNADPVGPRYTPPGWLDEYGTGDVWGGFGFSREEFPSSRFPDPFEKKAEEDYLKDSVVEEAEVQVYSWLEEIEGDDPVMLRIMTKLYESLSPEGQANLAHHGF